eukprot:556292_1
MRNNQCQSLHVDWDTPLHTMNVNTLHIYFQLLSHKEQQEDTETRARLLLQKAQTAERRLSMDLLFVGNYWRIFIWCCMANMKYITHNTEIQ